MKLELETNDLNQYLAATDVIDYDHKNIQLVAEHLAKTPHTQIDLAKTVYEYVRDTIPHSFDINGDIITCEASEVLKHKQGICFAKSHLLAALLRYLQIPTGFCYQKLVLDADKSVMTLHGLNAIYLESLDKWMRVDARGNKPGVKAEFNLEREVLAYSVREEEQEIDFPIVFCQPNQKVVAALRNSTTCEELIGNLPGEL